MLIILEVLLTVHLLFVELMNLVKPYKVDPSWFLAMGEAYE